MKEAELIRLFKTSDSRNTKILNGIWEFAIDPDNEGISGKCYEAFPDQHDLICVPPLKKSLNGREAITTRAYWTNTDGRNYRTAE